MYYFNVINCSLDVIFQVKEIYNYTQDDLITEDVLLLDCQREIYVWVGLHSAVKSKQEALNLGQVPTYYASTLIVTHAIESIYFILFIYGLHIAASFQYSTHILNSLH